MERQRSRGFQLPCLAAAALVVGTTAQNKVEHVDLFRALTRNGTQLESYGRMSNNNLADIVGVLRYLHQEVLPEHIQSDQDIREVRKYGINAIARYKMQVRNPDGLLADDTKQTVVGYGQYSAFDFGIFTSDPNLPDLVRFGDYVGASREKSPQILYQHDWYWFSVSGVCPNLPWNCVNPPNGQTPIQGCTASQPPTVPFRCQDGGCVGKFDSEPAVCKTDYPNFIGTNAADPKVAKGLRTCCLHYQEESTKAIAGGLCQKGTTPNGQRGCVYQYEDLTESDYVSLDDLVGYSKMKCGASGERMCTDWLDWRKSCYDPAGQYKRRFKCASCSGDGAWKVEVESTGFCTEYDLHPYCQETANLCKDPRCQALSPEEREIGVPFWRGKCDMLANQKRAEAVATALLKEVVAGKHLLTDPSVTGKSPPCSDPAKINQCTATPFGGTYCTRTYSGVCSPCFVPGTDPAYAQPAEHPACPLTLFSEPGVKVVGNTKCKSTKPRDLCCLYKIPGYTCTGTDDPATATLDVDGFMLVRAKRSTADMVTFAKRLISLQNGKVTDEAVLAADVYWLWDILPPKDSAEQLWQNATAKILGSKGVLITTTTTPTTTQTTTPTPGGGGGSGGGGGGGAAVGIIIAIIIVVALGALGFAFHYHRRTRDAARAGQVNEANILQMSRF